MVTTKAIKFKNGMCQGEKRDVCGPFMSEKEAKKFLDGNIQKGPDTYISKVS